MTNLHVLVVTNDRTLATALIDYLDAAGAWCDYGHDARTAIHLIGKLDLDVIVLDVGLASPDGTHICRHLRSKGEHRPILALSQRHSLEDRLATFAAGADDCQPTSCPLEELHVRLLALSQRSSGNSRRLALGALAMDLDSLQATSAGQLIKLSPTSFTLLETLMRAAPRCVSRLRLERAIWGDDPPENNTLNVHMYNLRKAIKTRCGNCLIETVRGNGFRLVTAQPGNPPTCAVAE